MTQGYNHYRGSTLFEARLEVLAPLHIGAGFDRIQDRADGETVEVAQLILAANGQPAITPTALKGAMRAIVKNAAGNDTAALLFGRELDHNIKTGAIGILTPYAALMKQPGDISHRREVRGRSKGGTFQAVRTAINGAAGVPASDKLFTTEMVAPGAVFSLRMRLLGDPRAVPEASAQAVAHLLELLQRDGLTLGRGRGDGQGLVKVTLERVTSRWADGQGIQSKDDLANWQRRIATNAQWQAPEHPYRFTLRGDAAFLVSAGPEASSQISDATQQGRQGRSNMIRALRRRNNEPELPGSSLMGALRARAEWLAGLRNLRGIPGHEKDSIHIAEIFGLRADQMEDSQLMKALADRLDVQPIQITGLAGRLRLRRITPQKAEVVELASVRLDRFTQAPMDGALFATEAFVMPCFDVDLQLSPHPCDACDAELRRWVRRLIRHIAQRGAVEEGIMLGHGRNRGFGWFTLREGP